MKIFLTVLLVTMLVAYFIIGVSSNIYVVRIFQILLSNCAFGGMGVVFWALYWCPVADVRNTLTGFSYNLGLALFVSTQFDVETYLADLDEYWGCIFAGLYIMFILSLSIGAAYWAENYHTWEIHLQMERANLAENAVVEEVHEDEDVSVAPAI